ncbi:hypothetical protein D3C87_1387880 [compost metagenome]
MAQTEQTAKDDEVFDAGDFFIDARVLARNADELAHKVSLAHHVVAEDACAAAIGPLQGGEHGNGGRLARTIRPEHAINDARRHVQRDAVDRAVLAEDFDEPLGLDGEWGEWFRHGVVFLSVPR